jgi:hypothetical protein
MDGLAFLYCSNVFSTLCKKKKCFCMQKLLSRDKQASDITKSGPEPNSLRSIWRKSFIVYHNVTINNVK